MNKQPPLGLSFPPDLSDEAAYEIAGFLEALSLAFEERYFAQIRRHRRAIHPKRSDLVDQPWGENPFQPSNPISGPRPCLPRCIT